jgi:hypothetical protein
MARRPEAARPEAPAVGTALVPGWLGLLLPVVAAAEVVGRMVVGTPPVGRMVVVVLTDQWGELELTAEEEGVTFEEEGVTMLLLEGVTTGVVVGMVTTGTWVLLLRGQSVTVAAHSVTVVVL